MSAKEKLSFKHDNFFMRLAPGQNSVVSGCSDLLPIILFSFHLKIHFMSLFVLLCRALHSMLYNISFTYCSRLNGDV